MRIDRQIADTELEFQQKYMERQNVIKRKFSKMLNQNQNHKFIIYFRYIKKVLKHIQSNNLTINNIIITNN